MTEKTGKIRLEYLDIAKAILIITVLLGHCIDPKGEIPFWVKLIYSFHMPLFFAICGITSHKAKDYSFKGFLKFLGSNAFALLLPYFIWGLIYSPFNLKSMGVLLYGSGRGIIAAGAGNGQFWFLPCLFLDDCKNRYFLKLGLVQKSNELARAKHYGNIHCPYAVCRCLYRRPGIGAA